MKKKFYIIWVEGSDKAPSTKFDSLEQAKDTAEKLVYSGFEGVHIMKLQSSCVKSVKYIKPSLMTIGENYNG